ncbi:hypothetical protein D187_004353 [Cystobacter fuscus DSM 2262]|uniref:Uncharacterized protein n=1 Tax=Cystobacter fuscus (strain ATCC 25194 / DSM 2262 / NBRC 100088 / M29) TaxID=1242864 RepID=S9Q9Q6_CYSF2|nr:DUF2892 domain-containing protein [Cystobacter fuscus]EPX58064.1 hypothetical protein D187_004353 [Cystobacter fuscus DSM 2262]
MESWNQSSTDAVRMHAPGEVNRRIDAEVERCVRHMAEQTDHSVISHYLEGLEKEWDLNRVVMVAASAVSLLGCVVPPRGGAWRLVGAVASGLLLQQGVFGFGPLSLLARRLGVRTRREIDLEKFALKALRGDFMRIPHEGGPLARANAALVAAQSD